MPRELCLTDGSLWVGIDAQYDVRELGWPDLGASDHIAGHRLRLGVWIDGQFAWLADDEWQRQLAYIEPCQTSRSVLTNPRLGLDLTVVEQVERINGLSVWRRWITVADLHRTGRDLRLFQSHDLRLSGTEVGDTALYDPATDSVTHYKADVALSFRGRSSQGGIREYACGVKAFAGWEGTWRDAEDGHLAGKPIEQGSVDSTFSLWTTTTADPQTFELNAVAFTDVRDLAHVWQSVPQATCPTGEPLEAQSDATITAVSHAIVRAHQHADGAFLAAIDTDIMETARAHYSYCWMRDGALAARTLLHLGDPDPATRFLTFADRCLKNDSLFRQKYDIRGNVGAGWHPWTVDPPALPIQQDETALTALVAAELALTRPDIEPFVQRLTTGLLDYRDADGLPLPSWDLWEERFGIHFWTVCTVLAALTAATKVVDDPKPVTQAAARLEELLTDRFCPPDAPIVRTLNPDGSLDQRADVSSLAGALLLPVTVTQRSALIERLAWEVESRLTTPHGIARYEGDYYFRRSETWAGNPWVIGTLWLAQARLELSDLEGAERLLASVTTLASAAGHLAEQSDPVDGTPLSVAPLAWSHAEWLTTQHLVSNARSSS